LKRKKTKRYSNSIERTFEIKLDKPSTGLRVVRIVVAALLIILVVGTIIFASRLYMTSDSDHSKTQATESEENSLDEELLRVVNKKTPIDEDYVPELVSYDGYSVSVLADSDLKAMLSDAAKEGIDLSVESAYISYSQQKKLYKQKYNYFRKSENLSQVRSQAKAEAVVPQAGNSEAQTGLLVTFKTKGKFDGSKASRWLKDNCVNYGFVWRYPSDKKDVTSMEMNPKAFRYVGEEYAKMMRTLNKTLDEYVVYINSR